MELQTRRCRIRPFSLDDVAAAQAYLGDPEVMRFIEAPFTEDQTRDFITQAGIEQRLVYAVDHRADRRLIGHVIWHPWVSTNSWELGWLLHRDYWRLGLAAELSAALIAHARQQPEIHTVMGETDPGNVASIAAMEKAGLTRAPELDQDLPVWAIKTG